MSLSIEIYSLESWLFQPLHLIDQEMKKKSDANSWKTLTGERMTIPIATTHGQQWKKAKIIEKAGKADDVDTVRQTMPELESAYKALKEAIDEKLKPLVEGH